MPHWHPYMSDGQIVFADSPPVNIACATAAVVALIAGAYWLAIDYIRKRRGLPPSAESLGPPWLRGLSSIAMGVILLAISIWRLNR
jgi:hypothetical protein